MNGCLLRWGRVLALASLTGPAAAQDAAFPFRDVADGISCKYFDAALLLGWPGGSAAWFDAAGAARGSQAYARVNVRRQDPQRVLRWDATSLVKAWAEGRHVNDGLMLAAQGDGGAEFHARESPDMATRPTLRVVHGGGAVEYLDAAADAHLDCSTVAGLGARDTLHVGRGSAAVLRFDLKRLRRGAARDVQAAELVLVRTPTLPWGDVEFALYRLGTPWRQALPPAPPGIARGHPGDRGIGRHPAVLFADGFDGGALAPGWGPSQLAQSTVTASDEARLFWPLLGPALRATVPRDQHLGLDLRYDFKARHRAEPDEVYLRYYLRLAADWLTTPDHGKLPGFGATYGRAGWGGRRWDGQAGWSARGSFGRPPPAGHPAQGRVALGSYVYHSDTGSNYGEIMVWAGADGSALILPDRWVCIEQHVKLNTPGQADGVLRAWVDGKPVFARHDLRLRDSPALHVEHAWMNVYVGGRTAAIAEMSLYIDQVVIATEYIGPMAP